MKTDEPGLDNLIHPEGASLFERVASILEQARSHVVRSVNANMVLAYWLIGREIVRELQGGEERAGYGMQIVENLSSQLSKQFGKGFSAQNLWNFRQFYQVYSERFEILSPPGRELGASRKLSPPGRELHALEIRHPSNNRSIQRLGVSRSTP